MPDLLIEGGARGADRLAQQAAVTLGLLFKEYPADWKLYGKAAGTHRNRLMLTDGRPDLVWAFHDDLAHSKGTADMIRQASKAKIPVEVFSHETSLI